MRGIAALLAVCLIASGVVVTRALVEGQRALHEADAAGEAGDVREAIAGYRAAARWYVPGAGHAKEAYDRLEEIGRAREAEGDRAGALAAWRGVRGSILATRSAYSPFDDRLERANAHIARLLAEKERARAGPASSDGLATAKDWHRDALARVNAPSPAWTLLAVFGLALWIAGAVVFVVRGVTASGVLARRPAIAAAVFVVMGLVIWLLGLARA